MIAQAWNWAGAVDIHSWFWAGAALLALGALVFLIMGLKDGPGHENHFATSFFITLIAATTYMAMALDLGKGLTGDGHVFYWARYVDWILTTPLLLMNLAMIATFNVGRKTALVAAIIGLDVFMIVTGLISAMTTGAAKWGFYILSCLAFLAVVGLIWGVLRAEAKKLTVAESDVYTRCTSILTVLWCAYPIVFLVGTEGLNLVGLPMEAMLYMVLDVAAKLGFGLVLLTAVRRLVPKQATDELEIVMEPMATPAYDATNSRNGNTPVGAGR